MDVWRITVAALRRWYVLLPLLALTGLAAYTAGEGVQPQYEVTATAVIVPGAVESEVANPYGGLDDTASVLSIVLDSNESRSQVEGRGLDPGYEVSTGSRNAIVSVTVLSDSEELALATGDGVLELARQELDERQQAAGITAEARIQLEVLQSPALSEVVTEGKLRNMAIIGVLGAAVSLLVAVLFDDIVGLLRRWLHRRAAARHPAPESAAAPAEDSADAAEDTADAAGEPAGASPRTSR